MSEAAISTFFAEVGAWIVLTQLVILRFLSKKYTEKNILRFSLLALACALTLYPFMPTPVFLYILLPFLTIPQGLSMANMGALISKSVSSEKQGAALGINSSLIALAQGVVPLAAGIGSAFIAVQVPFVVGACFVVIAWILLFVVKK